MKVLGISMIVLALVVGIVPLFTDCQSQGRALTLENGKTIPMKCHWTGRAELVAAFPLVGMGLVTALSRKKETGRAMGVMGLILGVFVILVPANLIGVCSTPSMLCLSVMRPTLLAAGALVIVLSGIVLVRSLGKDTSDI